MANPYFPKGLLHIGEFGRLGRIGPVYEIMGVVRDLPDGDTLMEISLLESGETVEVKLSSLLDAPEQARSL